ncbi:MAG TPA: N-acetylmuramoyl-L-alanine amidase [Thermodesulfovibrionales bacterium]|nr:N-acetylmuramoyl-L-alanine amidase [Thermodesulfovibrionales bacterium]
MLSPILHKRELRLRRTILKGVYEENLKIIGRHDCTDRYRLFFLSLKKPFFVFVLLLGMLGSWNYSEFSVLEERQQLVSADMLAQRTDYLTPETSMGPSDLAALIDGGRPLSRMFGLRVKTIMLDPGHGGTDPGTVGKLGTMEKDITLDIAKRLKQRLAKRGLYNVVLTRDEDVTLPLNKRVELANSGKADLFISIHLNYLPSKPINIIETYYFGPSNDAKTLRLAEQENASSHYKLSDIREMVEKIGKTIKLQESSVLAAAIQKSLFVNSRKQNGDIRDFGVKRAPFVVLMGAHAPGVLAEVSCLSNREEELELNTEVHRENIARYLEAGILEYLNKGEPHHEAKRVEDRR